MLTPKFYPPKSGGLMGLKNNGNNY